MTFGYSTEQRQSAGYFRNNQEIRLVTLQHGLFSLFLHFPTYLPANVGTGEPVGIQWATCGPRETAGLRRRHPLHRGSDWVHETPTCHRPVCWGPSWLARRPWSGSGVHRAHWCTWTLRSFPLRRDSPPGDRSWNKPEFCCRTPGCSVYPPCSAGNRLLGSLCALYFVFLFLSFRFVYPRRCL